MPEQDIVAELRHWLNQGAAPPRQVIERARDEIVALREQLERIGKYNRSQAKAVDHLIPAIRAEALEEAAQACEADIDLLHPDGARVCCACATAVRALKATP